jgi:hypothetical protein
VTASADLGLREDFWPILRLIWELKLTVGLDGLHAWSASGLVVCKWKGGRSCLGVSPIQMQERRPILCRTVTGVENRPPRQVVAECRTGQSEDPSCPNYGVRVGVGLAAQCEVVCTTPSSSHATEGAEKLGRISSDDTHPHSTGHSSNEDGGPRENACRHDSMEFSHRLALRATN